MDTSKERVRRSWRRHSAEFKASMIEACAQKGVSVASVALANGLNANLLRNWIVAAKKPTPALPADPAFVPVTITASPTLSEISIEMRRGEATIQVRWPIQAADACGVWLRTWLR